MKFYDLVFYLQEREPTGERASVCVAAAQRRAGTVSGPPEGCVATGHLWSRSYTQVGIAPTALRIFDTPLFEQPCVGDP
jgi:hypothetical protein